jgi:hypothetical protein
MHEFIHNQLTVMGPRIVLKEFLLTNWGKKLRAEYFDLIENSKTRFVGQFETTTVALHRLTALSQAWPRLVFLLDYENEKSRIKGLAKAKSGELEHCEISY